MCVISGLKYCLKISSENTGQNKEVKKKPISYLKRTKWVQAALLYYPLVVVEEVGYVLWWQ